MKLHHRCRFPVGLLALIALLSIPSAAVAREEATPTTAQSEAPLLGTVTVPSGLSADEVKGVVMRALVARRWIIQDKSDAKVVAHYERGKNSATLTITYDEKTIQIAGVGAARGGGFPMRWVENLKKDLGVFLGQVVATK